jgi:DNA-binding MarR family transcriptional regulator
MEDHRDKPSRAHGQDHRDDSLGAHGQDHRDEVDRLIAAWKRERPDVDLSPLAILSRITRISRHLDLARRDAFADLETWGFDVLAALRRAGEPHTLSPSQLMQETMVSSGTITNRLDRLEELRLITRQPDPSDGRGSLVSLTELGMKKVDVALDHLIESERAFLADLNKVEQAELANLLSRLAANFDIATEDQ